MEQIKQALSWLVRVKRPSGWGGNWHTDAPSCWTNVSICWVLARYARVYAPEGMDRAAIWNTIAPVALTDLELSTQGLVPISRAPEQPTVAIAPTAYAGRLLSETRARYWDLDEIDEETRDSISALAQKVTRGLVDSRVEDGHAKGWPFFPYGGTGDKPISVISTCLALRALGELAGAWAGENWPDEVLARAADMVSPAAVVELAATYADALDDGIGLPLQVGGNGTASPDLAATAAGILTLSELGAREEAPDLLDKLASGLESLAEDPEQSIELTSEFGAFHWFGPALALGALAAAGRDASNTVVLGLLRFLVGESRHSGEGYWRLVPFNRPSERINTWTTRDMVEALDRQHCLSATALEEALAEVGAEEVPRVQVEVEVEQAEEEAAAGTQPLVLMHLSDIHALAQWEAQADATSAYDTLYHSLWEDVVDRYDSHDPPIPKPNALLVSGDLVDKGELKCYQTADKLLRQLSEELLDIEHTRAVIVPGNHEVNWELSRWACRINPYETDPVVRDGVGDPDDLKYLYRLVGFKVFFDGYYPDYSFPLGSQTFVGFRQFWGNHRVAFAGFNSAVNSDHSELRRDRGHVPWEAPQQARTELADLPGAEDGIRCAVWHHDLIRELAAPDQPVTGTYNTRMLKKLAQHGFRILFHGHSHEASPYEWAGGTRLLVLGSGSLGAPQGQMPPNMLHYYQIVELDVAAQQCRVFGRQYQGDAWAPAPVFDGESWEQYDL